MAKLRVGVIFGGRSGEHEISLRSALTIMSSLDPAKYDILPIAISREGRWYLRTDAVHLLGDAAPKLEELDHGGTPVTLMPHHDEVGLVPDNTSSEVDPSAA